MSKDKMELATEAEPVAGMTLDLIEQRCKAWQGSLTVFERPNHQDAFREGYVAGWNDRESFHPAPAAPAAPRLHTTFCGDCQTHYFNHERHLCVYPTSV